MPKESRTDITSHLLPILLFVLALAASALAQTPETVLYNFPGGADGSNPYAGLIADSSGSLYGTTGEGGNSSQCSMGSGCGTVFMLTAPAWTPTILYSFQGVNTGDGSGPQASLVFDKKGALYGTTSSGGKYGAGTVFKLAPPAQQGGNWTETVLYSFSGGNDGSNPASGLIFDGTALCGTTPFGGSSGFGIVFELTPTKKLPWKETVLYNFTGLEDGGRPYAGLVLKTKALYGTTLDGGPSGEGSVFELAPPAIAGGPWTESVLYGFTGGSDGGKPYSGLVLGKAGVWYGTTGLGGSGGYGTVFQLTPPKAGGVWTESVLYSFGGGPDGAYARYGVVLDAKGNLYGTTGVGPDNAGVVFEVTPTVKNKIVTWSESVLWSFTGGGDGGDTTAGVVLDGGVLYGTTSLGGAFGDGTVFSVVP
jgi:uncharacterized repeat protein (TIGR03803 family)